MSLSLKADQNRNVEICFWSFFRRIIDQNFLNKNVPSRNNSQNGRVVQGARLKKHTEINTETYGLLVFNWRRGFEPHFWHSYYTSSMKFNNNAMFLFEHFLSRSLCDIAMLILVTRLYWSDVFFGAPQYLWVLLFCSFPFIFLNVFMFVSILYIPFLVLDIPISCCRKDSLVSGERHQSGVEPLLPTFCLSLLYNGPRLHMWTIHEYIRSRCTGVNGPMLNNRFQWVGQHEWHEKNRESIRGPNIFYYYPFVIDYPFSMLMYLCSCIFLSNKVMIFGRPLHWVSRWSRKLFWLHRLLENSVE